MQLLFKTKRSVLNSKEISKGGRGEKVSERARQNIQISGKSV